MTDRRGFIQLVGGGVLLAAAPALSSCTAGLPDPAAAWTSPGQGALDARLFALSHGILAPNPHNRQPWRVRLDGAEGATLFVDRARLLPVTDPFDRQIVIGCGAFIELCVVAASARGMGVELEAFPEGGGTDRLDDRPVARMRFAPGAPLDPLYPQIVRRRSNKEPYDLARPLTPAHRAAVLAAPGRSDIRTGLIDAKGLAPARAIVNGAYVREVETPRALKESIDLIRIGREEIARHRDGIDIDGPMIGPLNAVGLLTRKQMVTPGTMAFNQGRDMLAPLVASTPDFVWLATAGNSRVHQLDAGRAWARMALEATARGVALHPVSQGLQEYAEVAEFRARLDTLVGVRSGERLQMLARAGYGKPVRPAPRRGLAEHLIHDATPA